MEYADIRFSYYLSNSALELNEAPYWLGCEDPHSFGVSFRTWEGVPPSERCIGLQR
jgi:hypothetical protein